MQEVNFTIINHIAREKLGLSWEEYGLADLIYHLSSNPDSEIEGWCYASKDHLAKILCVSRREIHRMINTLLTLKLIEKSENTKFLKTTSLWYKTVITKSNNSSQGVTKSHIKVRPNVTQDSDQMSHNNNIYNNNNKDNVNTNVLTEKSKISPFGNSDINLLASYFLEKMQIPKEDCTQKQSRQYWNLLLKESKTGIEGVRWLIELAAADGYFRANITSSKDLYYKRIKLISRRREVQNDKRRGIDAEQILRNMGSSSGR